MQAYVLSIAGAVLISAIITVVAPEGKMGKFVKGMTKLLIIVVLVTPFVSWLSGGEISFASEEVGTDENYLTQCARMLSEEDERQIAARLKEEFSVTAAAQVTRRADATFSHEKIVVKILDFGISGQGEHIDILERVQAFLEEKYGCKAEVS